MTSFALVCLEAVIFQLGLEEYNSLHRVRGGKETRPPTPSTRSLWVSVTLSVALVTGFLFLLPQKTKPDGESQLTEAERAERAVWSLVLCFRRGLEEGDGPLQGE